MLWRPGVSQTEFDNICGMMNWFVKVVREGISLYDIPKGPRRLKRIKWIIMVQRKVVQALYHYRACYSTLLQDIQTYAGGWWNLLECLLVHVGVFGAEEIAGDDGCRQGKGKVMEVENGQDSGNQRGSNSSDGAVSGMTRNWMAQSGPQGGHGSGKQQDANSGGGPQDGQSKGAEKGVGGDAKGKGGGRDAEKGGGSEGGDHAE